MRKKVGHGFSFAHPGIVAALFALALSACNTTASPTAGQGYAGTKTIAFESIDGPPQPVFNKLVQKLDEESGKRQMPVVSREGFAPYRVRGYVAVEIEKKPNRTMVAWVWDVYDAEQRRVLRLSGEEPAPPAGRDAWLAANDAVLSRIAQNAVTQLAEFLQTPPPVETTPADAPASPSGPVVASADDSTPEGAGIFRLSQGPAGDSAATEAAPAAGGTAPADVPLPRRRPPQPRDHVALAITGSR
jgi:hypothetical protein